MVVICNKSYPAEKESKYAEWFGSYPYPLSDFQKYAIEAIVEGNHALVCAPTGSGKTLPGEFAINHFVEKGKKVIYCSPIKALSNQKYYEFSRKFPHISFGIYTGDIHCNPVADVLIMTTEILMNHLFNTIGAEKKETVPSLHFEIDVEKELACVVFDEIHYINDAHRGHVWEQTILMLPPQVQMVMLSATIDNPERFAKWCERDYTNKTVYLASTSHRVVPLTHYAYMTTTETVFKGLKDKVLEKQIRDSTNRLITIQTEKGKFMEGGYKELRNTLDVFQKKNVYMKRPHVLNNLALFLRDRDMLPAIAFVFSRKNVERCAHEISHNLLEDDSKVPYVVKRECEQIVRRLPNYQEYLQLPEYHDLVSLLEKGVGIHHSGMIPILREIVELFISKKYIKLLFATESFAIGLDCPIKTAIFLGLRKFDGENDRYLHSHEYTQAAGRAGRRGIDTIGHVIHCSNLFQLPSMGDYRTLLCGKPQSLVSKFHISYSVVLNMLKQKADFKTICRFVEKSMLFEEITKSIITRKQSVVDIEASIASKKSFIQNLKTTEEDCRKFIQLDQQYVMSVNKKKKQAEKDRQTFLERYTSCLEDSKHVKDLINLETSLEKEKQGLKYVETFIDTQVRKLCSILVEQNIIKENGEEFELEELGVMAANIAEVHPLVMARCIKKWDYFKDFTAIQLVGLFSCFTDIKIMKDYRRSVPSKKDGFLKSRLDEMNAMFIEYDKMEGDKDIRTGIHYDEIMVFDITDESMAWCSCENEADCKKFIQEYLFPKEISVGDFTKAILKISIIAKEIMNICELVGQVELLHKLSLIDGHILKYITINQSLYV